MARLWSGPERDVRTGGPPARVGAETVPFQRGVLEEVKRGRVLKKDHKRPRVTGPLFMGKAA